MIDYSSHLNTHPDFVTLRELSDWGKDHPDLWVQKLADYAYEIQDVFDTDSISSLNELIEVSRAELHSAETARIYAEQDQAEAEVKQQRAEENAKALVFELDTNEQAQVIKHLKSRIIDKSKEIDELKHSLSVTRSNFDELNKIHKELNAKYNTWLAIAT